MTSAGRASSEKNWQGLPIDDLEGSAIGTCSGMYDDDATGAVEWLAVTRASGTETIVPVVGAVEASGRVRVAFTHAVVVAAPASDTAGHLDGDAEVTFYDHYQVPYSDTDSDTLLPAADYSPAATDGGGRASDAPTAGQLAARPSPGSRRVRRSDQTSPAATAAVAAPPDIKPAPEPVYEAQPAAGATSLSGRAIPALGPLLIGGASVAVALAVQRYFARQQGGPNIGLPRVSAPSLRGARPSVAGTKAVRRSSAAGTKAVRRSSAAGTKAVRRSSAAGTKAVRQVRRTGTRLQPSVDASRVASAVTAPVVRPAVATARTARSGWQTLSDGLFFGIGYVLGTRDGRSRYEQMKGQAINLGQRAGISGLSDSGRPEPSLGSRERGGVEGTAGGPAAGESERLDGAAVVESHDSPAPTIDLATPADPPAGDTARPTGRQRRRAQRQPR